jgi:hypothetical protein
MRSEEATKGERRHGASEATTSQKKIRKTAVYLRAEAI